MIRAHGERDGKPFVLLGLEPQNLDRIRDGQPVVVNLRHLDPDGEPVETLPDLDVVVCLAGKDEMAMLVRKMGQ